MKAGALWEELGKVNMQVFLEVDSLRNPELETSVRPGAGGGGGGTINPPVEYLLCFFGDFFFSFC